MRKQVENKLKKEEALNNEDSFLFWNEIQSNPDFFQPYMTVGITLKIIK